MKSIVVTTVFEFLTNSPANFEVKIGRNCHVSAVEQRMKIFSHKQTVIDPMSSAVRVWLDVNCVQCGKCAFIRYGTAPIVCVRDKNAK